jgi:hypothetical protein
MRNNKIFTGIAAAVAAAGLIGTGAALSNAASTTSTATATTATSGPSQNGSTNPNHDAPVSGAELSSVTAAVKAHDGTVTVTSVRKDPDGSYDVFGTKAGATVMLEVSKDLKTVMTNAGGHGGHGGHGGGGDHGAGTDTPVTGAELSTVTAAVKAHDSAVTVTSVRKDPDGSYDVLGTKAGANLMLEVSKDLKTFDTNDGGQRG